MGEEVELAWHIVVEGVDRIAKMRTKAWIKFIPYTKKLRKERERRRFVKRYQQKKD